MEATRESAADASHDDMVTTLPDGRPLVDNTGRPIKRKRPQSCDFCRSRKTKCVRPEGEAANQPDNRCMQCRTAAVPCTWSYVPKRPGPQTHLNGGSGSSKRLRQGKSQAGQASESPASSAERTVTKKSLAAMGSSPQAAAAASSSTQALPQGPSARPGSLEGFLEAAQMSAHFDNPLPNPYQLSNYGLSHGQTSTSQGALPPLMHADDGRPPFQGPSPSHASSEHSTNQLPPIDWLAKPSPTSQHTPQQQQQQLRFDLQNLGKSTYPSPLSSTYGAGTPRSQTQNVFAPSGPSYSGQTEYSAYIPLTPTLDQRPSVSSDKGSAKASRGSSKLGKIFAAPIDRPRSIDDIAPRATFLSVISLYFHHLYPLMPIVHQPSFSHDLITRRDERDDDFLSFVLSLTAYTLIQCPRSVIPAPWPFYRKLHQICHLTSRRMQLDRHSHGFEPNLTVCATLYTTHIYMGSTGRTFAANAVHGELVRTAFSIHLHDETKLSPDAAAVSAAQQNPPQISEIDRQLRRRVAHLINGSDKTISILSDEPVSFPIGEWVGVEIPVAVDDDHIFPHKIASQPTERGPSILCGFETVSKLHIIMGGLVENIRADRRRPPTSVDEARSKLRYASSILRRIQEVVSEMPGDLLNPSFEHTEPPPRPCDILPDLGPSMYLPQAGMTGTTAARKGSFLGNTTGPGGDRGVGGQSKDRTTLPPVNLPFAPWPTGTFDENGLPVALDGASQGSSSAAASPMGWGPPTTGGPTLGGSILPPFVPSGQTVDNSSAHTPSAAQLNAARDQVVSFRPSPPPISSSSQSHFPILSGFAICRANILVTEAMLRFVLVDYREQLQGHLNRLRLASGEVNPEEEDDASKDIEEAARTFFSEAVATLPFDALAANGQSLVLKLVYIVSALLHRTSTSSRTYEYMSELLALLTQLTDRREEKPDDEEGEQSD
ncbi:hypothetical protein BCV69DRAFT_313250 [Microstroma glucosiphilum]|uniref:Zn(2)-C6 fungal-type domain-containing protein n=1 Tax=Pseudomicrostroma glucosiphilum TaxID=1684307 RepID=A0A316U4E0_9BASI|nr:hypothetical protein BCV69DRAFT_313250 [Pseudomicrostroma glucosiphilum]PWN20050.1 hypothetical protein BCV69DRAFT_313250 [Pseudomicrostroma glucosiphilum]